MIPDWFAALDQAWALLRPGGTIGLVDFYVARKHPQPGQRPQAWGTRLFWPWWFRMANVFLSPDHIPYVHRLFEPLHFSEHRAATPYLPGLRAPYYLFMGRKPAHACLVSHARPAVQQTCHGGYQPGNAGATPASPGQGLGNPG